MKGWHLKHAEDASGFGKRNYKKYGSVTRCIRQIEYDMHHGAQKREIVEIIRKIGRSKKYANIRSDPEAMGRLEELKDMLSGISKEEERLAWHQHAYKEKVKKVI